VKFDKFVAALVSQRETSSAVREEQPEAKLDKFVAALVSQRETSKVVREEQS
jgi:hypothetical protein